MWSVGDGREKKLFFLTLTGLVKEKNQTCDDCSHVTVTVIKCFYHHSQVQIIFPSEED